MCNLAGMGAHMHVWVDQCACLHSRYIDISVCVCVSMLICYLSFLFLYKSYCVTCMRVHVLRLMVQTNADNLWISASMPQKVQIRICKIHIGQIQL